MYLHIGKQSLHVTPVVLAGVAAGIGVGLTLLIICCCWCCCRCCCRRKNEKNKKSSRKINVENPPQVKGNQNEGAVEERQHKNNPDTSPTPQLPSPYVSRGTEDSTVPPQPSMPSFASSQTMFTYDELAIATNGFSRGNILGQGGFGFVHKGVLPKGKEIAVKSLKSDSGQGEREFQAEVEIISRVHHRHLVSLVGYCMTGSQRLLVYELVPNYTLEFHLHGKGRPALDWPTRMKIATGAAKGLAYLHEDCHPRIIHRDIKTANILIDNNFEAKVADFGLAKFNSAANADVTTRVMGTLGYLAPEYASSGKITSKSDVYSFGVMLLELITGRRPVNRQQPNMLLVEWARPLLTIAVEDENFSHLVDPRIQESYKHAEMSRMVNCAAICVRQSAQHRPKMSQVVRALEGNQSIKDLSVGITPGRSMVNRYESESEYSDSNYTGTSKGYGSSEIGGTTNEYGFNTSSSSNEVQSTPILNTEVAKRENNRRPRQRF